MAYQSVGKPRFYINVLEWLNSNGVVALPSEHYRTLPVRPTVFSTNSLSQSISILSDKSFVALLGHNGSSVPFTYNVPSWANAVGVINATAGAVPSYDGFSITTFNGEATTNPVLSADPWDTSIGSVVIGNYYDMPRSAELRVRMTRDMDGVKRMRTKGGNDLTDYRYTKPAMWGDAAAWELYQGTPTHHELSRVGRRIWRLSWKALKDSDVFPEVANITTHEASTPEGYTNAYYSDYGTNPYEWGLLQQNGWGNDNFYGNVVHTTNGGQLPFIFQPDVNYTNPDGFAICKFSMDSFEFEQVSNAIYSFNIKIKEVW